MSGRRVRQWKQAQARLAALPDCYCGAGATVEGDVLVLRPHAMTCPQLKAIADLSRAGFCRACGRRLRVDAGSFWRRRWCDAGHYSDLFVSEFSAR